jgi:RNA polymerase-binding transcription factor DksA
MTSKEQDGYRARLLALASRLQDADGRVAQEALRQSGGETSGQLSNVPMHMADVGTDAFEQEVSSSLMQNERQIQEEVAAALDRIEQGTFGRCQNCGEDIGKGRLDALPYTRYCVKCAQNAEDDGEVGFQPTLL